MDAYTKALLINDLCAKLPFGLKVQLTYEGKTYIGTLEAVFPDDESVCIKDINEPLPLNSYFIEEYNVKPYLRTFTSMSDEEREKFKQLCNPLLFPANITAISVWLNKNHFDQNGLTAVNYALEAPKGIYD